MCTSRRERGWSVEVNIRKWERKRIVIYLAVDAWQVSRCALRQRVKVARGGNSTISDNSLAVSIRSCIHRLTSEKKRDPSLGTSVLTKIFRIMKTSYFVFVSTEFFYRMTRCTCIDHDYLLISDEKKPLLATWASFLYCFLFLPFSSLITVTWEMMGKQVGPPGIQTYFMPIQSLACFARKIKGHEHHFNLPMAAVSFSFPFEWPNFWMRSLKARKPSCPFAARTTLVLYSPRTAKLTTWPRDSPSPYLGVEGERGQLVHASRPMSVSRLFGAPWDIELYWLRLILRDP